MAASREVSVDGSAAPVGAQPPRRGRWLGAVILLPVHLWRSTAMLRTPRCRYHPSCSTYAVAAVRSHGPLRGLALAVRRLGRCHPWSPGGFDRVPEPEDRSAWRRRFSAHSPSSD